MKILQIAEAKRTIIQSISALWMKKSMKIYLKATVISLLANFKYERNQSQYFKQKLQEFYDNNPHIDRYMLLF